MPYVNHISKETFVKLKYLMEFWIGRTLCKDKDPREVLSHSHGPVIHMNSKKGRDDVKPYRHMS